MKCTWKSSGEVALGRREQISSVRVRHGINRLMGQKPPNGSIRAGEAVDRVQNTFPTKALKKLGIEETSQHSRVCIQDALYYIVNK